MENHIKIPVRDCLGEERNSKKCSRDHSLHTEQHLRKAQCSNCVIYKLTMRKKKRGIMEDDLLIIFNWGSVNRQLLFSVNTDNKLNKNEWRFIIKKILPLSLWQIKTPQNTADSYFLQICLFYLAFVSCCLQVLWKSIFPSCCFCIPGIFPIKFFSPTLMLINIWQRTILCSVYAYYHYCHFAAFLSN